MTQSVPISKRIIAINSASAIFAAVLNGGILLWMHHYLLRRIPPDEYAVLPLVMSAAAFLPLLTSILTSGLARYIVEAYARDDHEKVTQIVSTMLPPLAAGALLLVAGGGLFSCYIDHILNIDPPYVGQARIMFFLMTVTIAAQVVATPFSVGMYVRQRLVLENMINVGAEVLRSGLLIGLLLGVSTSVLWVIVATVAANLARMFTVAIVSRSMVPSLRFSPRAFRRDRLRELTGYGAWNLVGQLMDLIRTSSDPLILNKLALQSDVASMNIGSLARQQIGRVAGLASGPLDPQLTAMHALGDKERLASAFLRGGRYALWAALLPAMPLIIFRREVIHLYAGDQYREAANVMALLLATVVVGYGGFMYPKIAQATAQIGVFARTTIATQLSNLGLTLILVGILKMGATGSAMGTFVALTFIQPILTIPPALKLVDLSFRRWWRETMVVGILPGMLAGAVWSIMNQVSPARGWFELGWYTCIGWCVYVGSLFLFCTQAYERKQVADLIDRLLRHRFTSSAIRKGS